MLKIFAIIAALVSIEATAYLWMHPAKPEESSPVLTYQPSFTSGLSAEMSADPSRENFPIYTALPKIYEKSAPSLRCDGGQVWHVQQSNYIGLYLAFFEWDRSETTSVLEAFKHLPEECMGSIGMKLVEKRSPRFFTLGSDVISFDHTVFRDPGGQLVHSFKGTWISGEVNLLKAGERGGVEHWNKIRWTAGLQRFRPEHARVIQGAVRGITDATVAWQTFEEAMLSDLKF